MQFAITAMMSVMSEIMSVMGPKLSLIHIWLEFSRYDDESGNHAYTTHQGALTQEQMDAILADMGV